MNKGPDRCCVKCHYWRPLTADGMHACHHCLDTGKCRERDGGRCGSFVPRGEPKKKQRLTPWSGAAGMKKTEGETKDG